MPIPTIVISRSLRQGTGLSSLPPIISASRNSALQLHGQSRLFLLQGDYGRKQKAMSVCLGGVVLFALSSLPIMRTWALYFLPLAYLNWIAGMMFVCAAVIWLQCHLHWGPFKYVRYGTPLVARIVSLELRPKMIFHGYAASYDYVARLPIS